MKTFLRILIDANMLVATFIFATTYSTDIVTGYVVTIAVAAYGVACFATGLDMRKNVL